MFSSQVSQMNQQEFGVFAELSLKNPIVYTTSKFDVGEKHSSLHLSLKSPAVFKKLRAT